MNNHADLVDVEVTGIGDIRPRQASEPGAPENQTELGVMITRRHPPGRWRVGGTARARRTHMARLQTASRTVPYVGSRMRSRKGCEVEPQPPPSQAQPAQEQQKAAAKRSKAAAPAADATVQPRRRPRPRARAAAPKTQAVQLCSVPPGPLRPGGAGRQEEARRN